MSDSPLSHFHRSPKPVIKRPAHNFVMRPLKAAARFVYYERGGRPLPVDVVTRILVADYKFAAAHKWNSVSVWEGGPGEGKSEAAIRMDRYWCFLTGGELKITWDIDEIPDLNDGDAFHVDEWLIPEGAGKIQAINRLWNLFTTLRAKQINASVATPKAPELHFLTFLATMLAQDFDNRENLAEIRVPLPRIGNVYIGNGDIPLHKDEAARTEYEAKSYARKTAVTERHGQKTIAPKLDYLQAAQIVTAWAKEQDLTIATKGQAAAALVVIAREREWDINYEAEDRIANLILMKQSHEVRAKEYTGQTVNLRRAIYQQLAEYGIEPESVAMFVEFVESGDSQAKIALRFGVSQPSLSNRIRPIREKAIGYAFEDVYAAKLKQEGKTIKTGGKQSDEPDILVLEGNEIAEVISLKCYIDPKPVVTIPSDQIAKSELDLWRQGKPLKLVFFDMITQQLFTIPYNGQDRFSLKKPPEYLEKSKAAVKA